MRGNCDFMVLNISKRVCCKKGGMELKRGLEGSGVGHLEVGV